MADDVTLPTHAELVIHVVSGLQTRTLNDFAAEARADGESLQQAVERYEIDYAWQVLGSDRLQEAAVRALETRLQQPITAAQRACVAAALREAAAGQAPELLMSFDNDVPEHLADLLGPAWGGLTD